MEWAARRKFFIALGIIGFLILSSVLWYFLKVYQAPSCFDGKQDQGEQGVDCGGPCSVVCPGQAAQPIVLWSRSFDVATGVYNAVAYVENPNTDLGVQEALYRFRLYDENNIFIAGVTGRIFLSPNEKFAIFEPRITTGNRIVRHTFFEFLSFSPWTKVAKNNSGLSVNSEKILNASTLPRVSAVLQNQTLNDISNINVVALVYDKDDNAIQASATQVDILPKESSLHLVFTWPSPFPDVPVRVEIIPRVNTFSP